MTKKIKKPVKNETVRRKILSMIIPITAENLLQMAAGTITIIFVGRINPLAVGAVGISNILYRILWNIFKGLGIGSSAYVAQNYGANNNHKIDYLAKQGMAFVLILSIVLQQIIYWNSDLFLQIFNPSPELLINASVFLKTISWAIPFSSIILLSTGIMQGMGNAKTPMVTVGIINVLNFTIGILLIFGNLGFPELGLKGAGYAFTIGHIVGSIFIIYELIKVIRDLNIKREKLGEISKINEFKTLLKYGIPTSFEMVFWQISSIFVTRAILTYGDAAYAAYQLGLQAEAISYMPATGISIVTATFIGQALGSKDKKMGKIYFNELIRISIIITAFTGGMLILFPKPIMRILTDNIQLIEIGKVYLFIMGLAQLPQNLGFLFNGIFRGAGYPNLPVISSGIGIWIIRIPLIMFVSYYFQADLIWIWLVMVVDLLFRFTFGLIVYKKKNIFV